MEMGVPGGWPSLDPTGQANPGQHWDVSCRKLGGICRFSRPGHLKWGGYLLGVGDREECQGSLWGDRWVIMSGVIIITIVSYCTVTVAKHCCRYSRLSVNWNSNSRFLPFAWDCQSTESLLIFTQHLPVPMGTGNGESTVLHDELTHLWT